MKCIAISMHEQKEKEFLICYSVFDYYFSKKRKFVGSYETKEIGLFLDVALNVILRSCYKYRDKNFYGGSISLNESIVFNALDGAIDTTQTNELKINEIHLLAYRFNIDIYCVNSKLEIVFNPVFSKRYIENEMRNL